MKLTKTSSFVLSAMLAVAPFAALAQGPGHDDHGGGHDDHGGNHGGYVQHNDWKKGGHIQQNDWNRGAQVDYRSHHLSAPPRGYQWRQVDGNYVLAAAATGVIASVIVASAAR
ncbi:RcnB family protein [Granulicella cerasi]|uniref:RcnB family protein n=1 Tax=Granulicella cerasi TaxID=741063 RepID=A0ABW1Z6N4_9BACT|nr:RcnB family protein [Granulicella cerasi]